MAELAHRIAHSVQSSTLVKEMLRRGVLIIFVAGAFVLMALAGTLDLKAGAIPSVGKWIDGVLSYIWQ